MGLIIKKEISTVGGFKTSEAYINIAQLYYNKSQNNIQIALGTYKDKSTREDGSEVVKLQDIPAMVTVSVDPEEISFENIYLKLKEELSKEIAMEDIIDD